MTVKDYPIKVCTLFIQTTVKFLPKSGLWVLETKQHISSKKMALISLLHLFVCIKCLIVCARFLCLLSLIKLKRKVKYETIESLSI